MTRFRCWFFGHRWAKSVVYADGRPSRYACLRCGCGR